MERDWEDFDFTLNKLNFNSHAHVERDHFRPLLQFHRLHFNSHAHVERDYFAVCFCIYSLISTHTLMWSVTPAENVLTFDDLFQLTRSCGA